MQAGDVRRDALEYKRTLAVPLSQLQVVHGDEVRARRSRTGTTGSRRGMSLRPDPLGLSGRLTTRGPTTRGRGSAMEPTEEPVPKQVIVMRRDLGMPRGKEIAQGAHASDHLAGPSHPPARLHVHRGRTPLARRGLHQGLRPGGLGGGAAGRRRRRPRRRASWSSSASMRGGPSSTASRRRPAAPSAPTSPSGSTRSPAT